MLRGISPILSPDFMKYIMEMGHGDELVLADRNFPAYSLGKRVIACGGVDICTLIDALIPLFPLDQALDYNAAVMRPNDNREMPLWEEFETHLSLGKDKVLPFKKLEKPDFYEQSKSAYLIVTTGEKRRFANLILRKGIILFDE